MMRLATLLFASSLIAPSLAVPHPAAGAAAELGPAAGRADPARTAAKSEIAASSEYGRLPLHFEPNVGQTADPVRFVSRGPGATLFLTSTEAVLALAGQPEPSAVRRRDAPAAEERTPGPAAVLRMQFVGANPSPRVVAERALPGKSNYFVGNDPAKWRTGVGQFARVRYQDLYPGIDLVYYGNAGRLEYDLVVAPGADPGAITVRWAGAEGVAVGADGRVVVGSRAGALRQEAPACYQQAGGGARVLAGRCVARGEGAIGFELGAYDRDRPVVIDPVLSYSTFLGGNDSDVGFDVAVDAAGSAYVVGTTSSTDFPTVNPYQAHRGAADAFVSKLSPSGSALEYSTYLGGDAPEEFRAIAIDGAGSAYVTGLTGSEDFPVVNAYQPALNTFQDAAVVKLSPAGDALLYSTYLGGSGLEVGAEIAVDGAGSAYVVGYTTSSDFPTVNARQSDQPDQDAFVTRFGAAGTSLVYSTYLGGSGVDLAHSVTVDITGNAYAVGSTGSTDFPTLGAVQVDQPGTDGFVACLTPAGDALAFSTYLGGSSGDIIEDVAVDGAGSIYVVGVTFSTDFPTVNAYQTNRPLEDGFVAKLAPGAGALVYSTYLGGNGPDYARGVALDPAGNACVAGDTLSSDFPTVDPYQIDQPGADAWAAKVSPTGNALVYSTYLGGSETEGVFGIGVDQSGNVYVTGVTSSPDFPTVNALQGELGGPPDSDGVDAFVTKLNPAIAPPPAITCPADVTAAATAGAPGGGPCAPGAACALGAQVTYPAPVVSGPPGTVVACVPASGSFFPLGTTAVTCTATDPAGDTATCTFTVTVAAPLGDCFVDDATGDSFSLVIDPASPLYGFWRYRVAATGQVLCGVAERTRYVPGRSLAAADRDGRCATMSASINYATGAGMVRVLDRVTSVAYTLRDRNVNDDPSCP